MFKTPELPSRYGEYGASGEIVKDAKYCAVTGQLIEPGDVTIGVQGSKRFYRISAAAYRLMSREDHEALYAEMQGGAAFPSGSTFDPSANAVTVAPPAEQSSRTWDAPAVNTGFSTARVESKGKEIGDG